MHDEYQNRFDRAQRATLAEDRQTRFQRHHALQRKQRAASDTQAAREARREVDRNRWHGDGRLKNRGEGFSLGEEVEKLKRAAYEDRASRSVPKAEIPQISDEDMAALFDRFVRTCPQYVRTSLNAANLLNAMLHNVGNGKVTWSVANIRKVFDWLLANGYIETIPQTGTRTLADASHPPTRVYPAHVSKQRQAKDALNMAIAAQLVDEAEARRAQAMPFDELQKQVRHENKHYGSRQEPI